MYRKIEDFTNNWEIESKGTLIIFGNLTDESMSRKVSADGRSLGFIAWHITQTLTEMLGHAKLKLDSTADKDEMPTTISEIVSIYERDSKAAAVALGKLDVPYLSAHITEFQSLEKWA